MKGERVKELVLSIVFVVLFANTVFSQSISEIKGELNKGTIKLITGGVKSNTAVKDIRDLTRPDLIDRHKLQFASEIATVVDQRNEIRVLPILGYGSVGNIRDLLYLRGVDFCIVNSDVLSYIKQKQLYTDGHWKLRHVVSLYDEAVHVIAHRSVTDLSELEGKPVIIGRPGSSSEMSARTLFAQMKVSPGFLHVEWKKGLELVRDRRAAAMVFPAPVGDRFLQELSGTEFRLLELPFNSAMGKTYKRALITHEDYPFLVSIGHPVLTVQYSTMIATYNWSEGTQRYSNVNKFVQRLVFSLDRLKSGGWHHKWKDLDLKSVPPGWKRLDSVNTLINSPEFLNRRQNERTERLVLAMKQEDEYGRFVRKMRKVSRLANVNDKVLRKLFDEFQQWKRSQLARR